MLSQSQTGEQVRTTVSDLRELSLGEVAGAGMHREPPTHHPQVLSQKIGTSGLTQAFPGRGTCPVHISRTL